MKKILSFMSLTLLVAGCADRTMPVADLPEIDTSNPLLAEWETPYATPPFERIELKDYEPAFDAAIAVQRAEIEAIVKNPAKPSFHNTIVALERSGELLSRIEGLFYNLLEADSNDEMQRIALDVQPKLTALSNDIALDPALFARVKAVYENPGWFLSKEDKRLLEKTYKSFARNGAALPADKQELYRQYTTELGEMTLKFGQNSLAATNAFTLNITDPGRVEELPDFVKEGLAADAKARGEKGWTVTLQYPSYVPFMTYSSDREAKEQLWRAAEGGGAGGEGGGQRELPVRAPKKEKRLEEKTVFLLLGPEGTALRQRPDTGLLAGLWEYPHVPGRLTEEQAARQLRQWGLTPRAWLRQLDARHIFTHIRWEMTGYLVQVEGLGPADWLWADEARRQRLAIPSAFDQFTRALPAEGD